MRHTIWVIPSAASIYAQSCAPKGATSRICSIRLEGTSPLISWRQSFLTAFHSTRRLFSLRYCFLFLFYIFFKCFDYSIEVENIYLLDVYEIFSFTNLPQNRHTASFFSSPIKIINIITTMAIRIHPSAIRMLNEYDSQIQSTSTIAHKTQQKQNLI